MSLDDVMGDFQERVVEAQARADPTLLSAAVARGELLLRRPDLPAYAAMVIAANLCVLLMSLHEVTGDLAAIDASVDMGRKALVASADVPEFTPRYASNLGASLLARYRDLHRAKDLDEGVG